MKRTIPAPPLPSLIPAPSTGGNLAQARQVIGNAPLIAAKGLAQDLLALHSLNLAQLMHAIQQPGSLLDEDSIPHKMILERISVLQKDILAASHALLKLEEALSVEKAKTTSRGEGNAIASVANESPTEEEKPSDISTIVLQLEKERKPITD